MTTVDDTALLINLRHITVFSYTLAQISSLLSHIQNVCDRISE
jgi:hypothetical protein